MTVRTAPLTVLGVCSICRGYLDLTPELAAEVAVGDVVYLPIRRRGQKIIRLAIATAAPVDVGGGVWRVLVIADPEMDAR